MTGKVFAPWRLYRRDVLCDDPFPVGLYYEDLASTYKFVQRAGRIALLDCRDLYAYRMRDSSIIRQCYSQTKGASAIVVSRQLYEDISRDYPELATAAASRCFSVCRMVYAQVPREEKAAADALWNEIKRYCNTVSSDGEARKRERFAAAIAEMGRAPFDAFCFACRKAGLMR